MVVMGGRFGFQVSLTSNNHEILFIQPVSLDLVGIDTLITCISQIASQ